MRNNSQHCWAKNVGNCYVCVASGVQTDVAASHADVLKLCANGRNNSQQCWELLPNNVASVFLGLKQPQRRRKRLI